MTRKKKEENSKAIVYILILLIFIAIYNFFTPEDLKTQVNSTYNSGVNVEEPSNTQENNSSIGNVEITSDLELYFWNVGQADSTFISCSGEYMLIDAGNNADGKYIVKQLQDMGIEKIDYLVGTHPHEDHIGGLDNIIKSFKIGKIYMPKRQADSKTFEDVLDAVSEKKLKISTPKKGESFVLGQADCKVLSVESDAEDTNDSSIVIQINFGKHKFLFTGDLTSNIEKEIDWEDVDVLKVAHHGSRYSSSSEFLNAAKPEIAVISVGKDNDYNHPHKEALNRLKKINTTIYRTDEKGTIYLRDDAKNISVKFLNISLDGNGK